MQKMHQSRVDSNANGSPVKNKERKKVTGASIVVVLNGRRTMQNNLNCPSHEYSTLAAKFSIV